MFSDIMKHLAEHQLYALACMDYNPCLGLFYDPGCGKTIIALTWIRDALRSGKIKDALVVCPASLVPNWEKDIAEATDFDHMTADDVRLLQENVTIRSFQKTYSTLKREIQHHDGQIEVVKKRVIREDLDKSWGAIIIDESHGIGSHKSMQYKAAFALAGTTKYRYIMTGTPIHGSTRSGGPDYSKLFGQFKFLFPDIWKNWTAFCREYVTAWTEYKAPAAYKDAELRKLMQDNAIAIRLRDCFDLPEATETVVPCPLVETKVYKDIREHRIEQYGLDNPKSIFGKLLQVCSGSLITEKETKNFKTSKDEALKEIIEGTDDKIVVFCKHTASIDRCAAICEAAGRKTIVFDGRSNGPVWRDFEKPEYTAIVCQYQSGGSGLNLQAANTMVFYEPCFSTTDWKQAHRRIERPGQTKKMRYICLTTPKTAEDKVLKSVMGGISVTDDKIERWVLNNEI